MRELEMENEGLITHMVEAMQHVPDLESALEMGDQGEQIMATMEAQATLCHNSSLRSELQPVHDSSTLESIASQLRMAVYEEALAEKMREW